jgi:hypothetical protein
MKKLIAVSILLTILSATAFAQLKISLDADFYPELMRATAPLDDAEDTQSGTFDFLTTLGTWKSSELRLKLNYDDPDGNYNGYVRLNGDSLIGTNPALLGFDPTGGSSGNDYFTGVLTRVLDEYYIKGKVGILSGYFANNADRGKTDRFQNFSNFMDKVKIDNYGLMGITPPPSGLTGGAFFTYDINNFAKSPDNDSLIYAGVGVDLNPVYIGLSGGINDVPAGMTSSYSRGHAGIRVSGVGIADMVTFDVIYKINGSDPNTYKDSVPDQPDGVGEWENAFGLIANISAVENLGIGIGYSGYFMVHEEDDAGDVKYTFPLYSGIDLRFAFTGVEKLSITFNNNISFTGATGDKKAGKMSVDNINQLGEDETESYIGLYNALAVGYQLADGLTARGEIANRFGSYTYDDGNDKYIYSLDNLLVALSAVYSLNSHVGLEGGLAFGIAHQTLDQPGDTLKAGTFTFGIPLRVHVVF